MKRFKFLNGEEDLGVVGVDSGELLIIDPCYLYNKKEFATLMKALEENQTSHKKFYNIKYTLGHPGLGVVFSSGWGDGLFEVVGTFKNNLAKKVEIIF